MSRAIKFRAWDGKSMWFPCNENDLMVLIGDSGYFEVQDHGQGRTAVNVFNSSDDSKAILMQFTGLKEHANDDTSLNRDIYEGDIIEFINGEKVSVEWNDDTCQFQFSDGSPINDGERYATHKRIIGNIYETPTP